MWRSVEFESKKWRTNRFSLQFTCHHDFHTKSNECGVQWNECGVQWNSNRKSGERIVSHFSSHVITIFTRKASDLKSRGFPGSFAQFEIPGNPRRRDMYECQHKDVLRTSTYPIDAICVPACYLWYIN